MSEPSTGAKAGACPDEHALSAWVAMGGGGATGEHVDGCARCRETVAGLREEERFAARFAAVVRSRPGERGAEVLGGELPRPVVPGYTIEGEISRGGQGVVYRGVQHETRRAVAIKAILSGVLASAREVARFEREVEIAASLRHPNIVTVFEARQLADGRHVLAMELVDGVPLSEWAERAAKGRDGLRERLGLMLAAARAVEYAHRRGVIHRDLKPANVLVDREGVPRVLDFGLARRRAGVDSSSGVRRLPRGGESVGALGPTIHGMFQGTPAYAAPEQFEIEDSSQLDVRVDVYSLGVMLYELLTGVTPYSESKGDLATIVREKRSGVLSAREGAARAGLVGVGRDVDAVIARATAAARDERYSTAGELAADLEVLLVGGAVAARRGEMVYQWRKAIKRHRLLVSMVAAGVAVAGAFAVVQRGHVRRLDAERARLSAALRESTIQRAMALSAVGDRFVAERLLWGEGFRAAGEVFGVGAWERAVKGGLDERRALWGLMEIQFPAPCEAVQRLETKGVFAGERGGRLRIVHRDGWLREYDAMRLVLVGEPRQVCEPMGNANLMGNEHGVIVIREDGPEYVDLSGKEDGVTVHRVQSAKHDFRAVVLSNDGSYAAGLGPGRPTVVWSLPEMKEVMTIPWSNWPLQAPAFSPDGTRLYCIGSSGRMEGYTVPAGKEFVPEFLWAPQFFSLVKEAPGRAALRISDDGRRMLVLTEEGVVVMGAGSTSGSGSVPAMMAMPQITVGRGATGDFGAKGRLLLTGGNGDPEFRIRDANTLEELMVCRGLEGGLERTKFSSDGSGVFTMDWGGGLRRWSMEALLPRGAGETGVRPAWRRVVPGSQTPPHSIRVDAGGVLRMAMSDGRVVESVSPWTGESVSVETGLKPARVVAAVKRASGAVVIVAGNGGDVLVYESTLRGGVTKRLSMPAGADVFGMDVSPDGTMVAAATGGSLVKVWRTSDWSEVASREIGQGRVRSLAWLPDSSAVMLAGGDARAVVLRADDLSEVSSSPKHEGQLRGACVTSDGRSAVTFGDEGVVRFWEMESVQGGSSHGGWKLRHDRMRSAMPAYALALHPSGRVAAAGHLNGAVQFFDVETGVVMARVQVSTAVMSLAFSEDGRQVVVGAGSEGAEVWDLSRLAGFVEGGRQYWKATLTEVE